MFKILKGVRNHPKKSIFFGGIFSYAGNFAQGKYNERCMMRAYCLEALEYGQKPFSVEDERHVTVILNPAANDGKGKGKYEKYCAPLLHLAGLKVALVRTEHEDEAKHLMGVMDNTSAVIVAGGDGTLSEVLTGLLRRDDAESASKRFPLGILPLGASNSAASVLFGFNGTPEVKHLAESTMAIVRNIKRPLDVMEVSPQELPVVQEDIIENDLTETSNKGDQSPKPVFAASHIEWGAFRDTHDRKSIYWYWAFLKKYAVYIFSSYKDLSWDCAADLSFSSPCSGCSKCREKKQEEPTHNRPKRWWEAFVPRTNNLNKEETSIDYSQIINEDCGLMFNRKLEKISDVRITTCNSADSTSIPGYSLKIKLGKENLSWFEFIKEGWKREWNGEKNHDVEYTVGEIFLQPEERTFKDKQDKDRKMNIDSGDFEIRPMRIKPRQQAVTVFAQPINQSLVNS